MTFKQFRVAGVAAAVSAEDKPNHAQKAIAAAKAKILAVNVGAAGGAPRLYPEAVRELHIAQHELNHHAKVID